MKTPAGCGHVRWNQEVTQFMGDREAPPLWSPTWGEDDRTKGLMPSWRQTSSIAKFGGSRGAKLMDAPGELGRGAQSVEFKPIEAQSRSSRRSFRISIII
nr:hypothetical protein [Tsuneonella amylolytica]